MYSTPEPNLHTVGNFDHAYYLDKGLHSRGLTTINCRANVTASTYFAPRFRPNVSRKMSSLPTLRVRLPPHPWYEEPPFQLQGNIDLRLHPSSPHRKINDFGVSLREIVSDGNHFHVGKTVVNLSVPVWTYHA